MIPKPVAEHFSDLNISALYDKKKKTLNMVTPYTSMRKLIDLYPKAAIEFGRNHNENEVDDCLSEERSKWRGGTMSDLTSNLKGDIDMTGFLAARKKLEETGILANLRTMLEKVQPKRSRRFSEHDGDWEYDRRWERQPFASTTRRLSDGKFMEIECTFSVNCDISASDLNQYGMLVWAISDLIEQCGICTKIQQVFDTEGVYEDERGTSQNIHAIVTVKDTNQYIAPPLLAATCQSNFYRRFAFAFWIMGCDFMERPIEDGYGHGHSGDKSIVFEDGKLKTFPALVDHPEKMVRAILQAFERNQGGEQDG